LVLVAFGNNAARKGGGGLQPLFWGGLVLIYAPITFRLLGDAARRPERIGLVLTLGLSVYAVKVLNSPAAFVDFDEFGWWRATHEVVLSGGTLPNGNALNAGTEGYPTLSTVTAALSQLAGLSIFHAGLIVIGLARALLVLALFLFLERVLGSGRGAGIGIAVYVCNPSLLYFDAQFGYESLALGLAAAFLLIILRWSRRPAGAPAIAGVAGVLVLLGCGVTVTHHMTSLAVLTFLAGWTGIRALTLRVSDRQSDEREMRGPLAPTLLLAIMIAIWLGLVAGSATMAELGGLFSRAFESVIDLILGNSSSKKLFSGAGQSETVAARTLAVTSVVLMLLLVVAGVLAMWRDRVRNPLWLALGAVAIIYPLTLGLRLTSESSEISQRASASVFLGVAFIAGVLSIRKKWPGRRRSAALATKGVLTALAATCFVGGFIIGQLKATRQPGPYLVGAEARSVTPEGVAAAEFAAAHLPPNSRLLADRTDASLMASYGRMDPIFGRYGRSALPRVLFSSRFDETDRRIIRGQSLAYIVVDRRLSSGLPLIGFYVESDEPGAFVRTQPISRVALDKFEAVRDLTKIYANGPIIIYDASSLLR
jgi:hypothetical protein